MSARDEFDRRLADWMTQSASRPAPAGRFEDAKEATSRRRPRRRWLAGFGSDWVGTAAPRAIEWAPRLDLRRGVLLGVLIALLAAAIISAALVGAQLRLRDRNPFPDSTSNGWIAFAADNAPFDGPTLQDYQIYVVGKTGEAKGIVGAAPDGFDRMCPAFSADGIRLAFGQARSASPTSYRDAALVITDIDANGNVSNERAIPVGGTSRPPCPVWSPDGQRIAFIEVNRASDTSYYGLSPEDNAVWVVTLDGGQVKKLPGVRASYLSWAPDGSQLAIASGGVPLSDIPPFVGSPILLYSVASGQALPLPGTSNAVTVAWSPDGRRIAYQGIVTQTVAYGGILAMKQEIWTIGADGSRRTLQTQPFDANQGIGPMWSPSGDRIVYQRICGGCRGEAHDVVVLTPGTSLSETTPAGIEVVLPRAVTDGPYGREVWWPFEVSWSPDGQKLLCVAWSEAAPWWQPNGSGSEEGGLVLVDPDVGAPAVLLHKGNIRVVAASGPSNIPGTSWGRLP